MLTLLALVGKMLARPVNDRTDATRKEAAETSGTMRSTRVSRAGSLGLKSLTPTAST